MGNFVITFVSKNSTSSIILDLDDMNHLSKLSSSILEKIKLLRLKQRKGGVRLINDHVDDRKVKKRKYVEVLDTGKIKSEMNINTSDNVI